MSDDPMIKEGGLGDFKYCKNCKYSIQSPHQIMLQCESPKILHMHHLVFGLQRPDCEMMRSKDGECGEKAILFEKKE